MCGRPFNTRRKPHCASCVQATLYPARVQQASALLGREKSHNHAEAVVRPGNDGVLAALAEDANWDAITVGAKKHSIERARGEQEAVESRIGDITQKAVELRRQMEQYTVDIAKRKQQHARRRKDLAAERKQLDSHKARLTEPLHSTIRRTGQRLDKAHSRTIDARTVLCREAAALSGLQKVKGRDGKSEYWLGGMPVRDLRDFNGKVNLEDAPTSVEPHDVVSASLDNVCRLLGSCCHYLSVRLPAEVILPHNDFPHSMILPEKASYRVKDPPYPGNASSHSSSPLASRSFERNDISRPRLLHLDRSLVQLVRDDSKAFGLFIEAVMLLAWDVAWLCRTQGIDDINSFADVCAIGKNLYRLLVAQESSAPSTLAVTKHGAPASDRDQPNSNTRLGSLSHGSAHGSLFSAEGRELVRSWRLASPARLIDRFKSYLLAEISNTEWDFVDDDEWDEEQENEKAVLVGGARRSLDSKYEPAMSVMTVAPSDGAAEVPSKAKGSSGWMKVRGRGSDE